MNNDLNTILNLDHFIFYNWFPAIADHCIDESEDFYRSAGVSRLHDFDPHTIYPSLVKERDIIFCKTDYIFNGFFQKDVLPHINNPFILISGISSFHIGSNGDKSYLDILKNPNLMKWFCTNPPDDEINKIIPLPIGFEEKERDGGNQSLLFDCHENRKEFKEKKPKVLLPFHNIETNSKREKQVEELKQLPFVFHQEERLSFKEYMDLVNDYKFVICLEGSGPDVHRNYEALLVNTIPINKKNITERLFQTYALPGEFLDSWDNLNIDFFDKLMRTSYDMNRVRQFLTVRSHVDRIAKQKIII